MKLLDKAVLYLSTFIVFLLSLIMVIVPFIKIDSGVWLNMKNQVYGNYTLAIAGGLVLLLTARTIVSSNRRRPDKEIVSSMSGGDLRITDEAIRGIAENAINKFRGIREHKINVVFEENNMILNIEGAVTQDINIPQIAEEIQDSVTDIIRSSTGMDVGRVNVKISRFSNNSNVTVR